MAYLYKKTIAHSEPWMPPADACWNNRNIPWKELGITEPKKQISLWKTAAMHDGQILDYQDFLIKIRRSVLSSAVITDIDGTVMRPQSQIGLSEIRTLADPEYKQRLELMFLFITCGFPLYFTSGGSQKSQVKKVIEPLIQIAEHRGLLPAMENVGIFVDSVTRFFQIKNGVLREDENYSKLTQFEQGLGEKLLSRAHRVIDDYNSALYTEPEMVIPPSLRVRARVSLENPGKIVISPFPSWRHNILLYNQDPAQRMDIRSRVIRALQDDFSKNDVLGNVAITEGGNTSIDITAAHVTKGFSLEYLKQNVLRGHTHITYMGDEVYPGGNDMSVAELNLRPESPGPEMPRLSVMALNRVTQSVPIDIKGVFPVGTNDFFSLSVFQMYLLVLKNIINYDKMGDVGSIGPIVAGVFENLTQRTILRQNPSA